jgi:hypothetical protein
MRTVQSVLSAREWKRKRTPGPTPIPVQQATMAFTPADVPIFLVITDKSGFLDAAKAWSDNPK